MSFLGSDIISVSQYQREDLERVFSIAEACIPIALGARSRRPLEGKVLANLFYEPSTRTRLSFGTAFLRLGGALETTVGMQFSSMVKGETLSDTIRVIDGYADAIVLRHPQKGAAAIAAKVAKNPVINAGDGDGEHPTQAVLDLFTIRQELGHVDETNIALVGDLRFGRTVHSLAKLLAIYDRVRLLFVSPDALTMPEKITNLLDARGVAWERVESLDMAVKRADVLYVTRIQAERFQDPTMAARLAGSYLVDHELIVRNKREDIIIMHPLPRYNDLSTDVDKLPGAAYFRQAHYGVPVRMALFCEIFGCMP